MCNVMEVSIGQRIFPMTGRILSVLLLCELKLPVSHWIILFFWKLLTWTWIIINQRIFQKKERIFHHNIFDEVSFLYSFHKSMCSGYVVYSPCWKIYFLCKSLLCVCGLINYNYTHPDRSITRDNVMRSSNVELN